MRPALTAPILGSATSRSRTRAVLAHGGGSARIAASSIFPAASSRFSSALAVRTSFACSSARSRCSRDLPGTPAPALLSTTPRFWSQNRQPVNPAASDHLHVSANTVSTSSIDSFAAGIEFAHPTGELVQLSTAPVESVDENTRTVAAAKGEIGTLRAPT